MDNLDAQCKWRWKCRCSKYGSSHGPGETRGKQHSDGEKTEENIPGVGEKLKKMLATTVAKPKKNMEMENIISQFYANTSPLGVTHEAGVNINSPNNMREYKRCIKKEIKDDRRKPLTLTGLPSEMLLAIFMFLPKSSLVSVSGTCRYLRGLALDPPSWTALTMRYRGQNSPEAGGDLVTRFTKLTELNIKGMTFSGNEQRCGDVMSIVMKSKKTLTRLFIQSALTNSSLTQLSMMTNLRSLIINGRLINAEGLLMLSGLTELREFITWDYYGGAIVNEHIPNTAEQFFSAMKNLKVVKFHWMFGLTLEQLEALVINNPDLEQLNMGQLPKWSRIMFHHNQITNTNAGVSLLADRCRRLTHVRIRGQDVDDAVILRLVTSCPRLEDVRLDCTLVTDATLATLATSCPNLKYLDISGSDRVTSEGIETMLASALKLKNLVMVETLSEGQRSALIKKINKEYPKIEIKVKNDMNPEKKSSLWIY